MERQSVMPLFSILIMLLSACQPAPNVLSVVATPTPSNPTVFQDEFDGKELDREKWTTQHGWGRTNEPELQYYAEDALTTQNGILTMKAEARNIENMAYSSGMINSMNSFTFTYGYVEARIKIPAGQGLWPALWLLDAGGSADEIDIVEILGHAPEMLYMTLHYADSDGNESGTSDKHYHGPNFSDDFHTFGLDWQEGNIVWYVDGLEQYRVTENVPGKPMYLIANLAVGGEWPGAPDESTHFPATYEIDYIRVYEKYQP